MRNTLTAKAAAILVAFAFVTACAEPAELALPNSVPQRSTTTRVVEPPTSETTTTTAPPTTTIPPTTTTTVPPRATQPEAMVGGLVVSMGEPPAEAVARYGDWGANVVMLWEPEEAKYWLDYPAISWVTPTGQQVNDPTTKEDPASWQPLELPHNVFAVQVGDEPIPDGSSQYGLHRPVPGRLDLPEGIGQFTNFSYWSPLDDGYSNMEPPLDAMYGQYQGEAVITGEYNLRETSIRYQVLDYFRRKGLELGQPYWQYLNAYSGYETDWVKAHTTSDLAWQGFGGAVMGYTGHFWFVYQIADTPGHGEAIKGGGSVFYEGPGNWTETPLWNETARINAGLLAMSEKVAGLTSTDVSWRGSEFGSGLLVGEFNDGAAYGILNSNHTQAGSDEPVNVTIPFDAKVWSAETQAEILVEAGGQVQVNAGWAILVEAA